MIWAVMLIWCRVAGTVVVGGVVIQGFDRSIKNTLLTTVHCVLLDRSVSRWLLTSGKLDVIGYNEDT